MKYSVFKHALLTNKHILISTIVPTIYLILYFIRLFSHVVEKHVALRELIFLCHWSIYITLAVASILITVIRFDQSIQTNESDYHSYPYTCMYLSLLGLHMSTRGLHAPQETISLVIGIIGLSLFISSSLFFSIAEVVISYNENVNMYQKDTENQITRYYTNVDDLKKQDLINTSHIERHKVFDITI